MPGLRDGRGREAAAAKMPRRGGRGRAADLCANPRYITDCLSGLDQPTGCPTVSAPTLNANNYFIC